MSGKLERQAELFLAFKKYFGGEQVTLPKPGDIVQGAQSFAEVPMLLSDTLHLRYDFLIGFKNYLAVSENNVYSKEIEIFCKITPIVLAAKQVLSARLLNTDIHLQRKVPTKEEQPKKGPPDYSQVLGKVSSMCTRRITLTLINNLAAANKVEWETLSENPEFEALLEIGKYHYYFPMREFLSSAIQCLILSLVPVLLERVRQQKCEKKFKFFQDSQELTVADVVDVCEQVLEIEHGLDEENNHSLSLISTAGNAIPTGNHIFFARISEFGIMLSIFFTNLVQCLCMIKFFEKENTIDENAVSAIPLQSMCI